MIKSLFVGVVIVALTISSALAGEYFVKHTDVDRPDARSVRKHDRRTSRAMLLGLATRR
jgi:hypothetical protein